MKDLIADYLDNKRSLGLSPRTVQQAIDVLERQFLPWCLKEGITTPAQLNQRTVDRWNAHLLSRDLARASARTYTRVVAVLVHWAQEQGEVDPKLKVRQPRKEKKLVETLTRAQIEQLEAAATTVRDALIIRTLADTGVRLGELLSLRPNDVLERGRDGRYIRVRGKTGERLVPVTPQLFPRLRRQASLNGERLFMTNRRSRRTTDFEPLAARTLQNMIRYTAIKAGLGAKVHPHTLRHSWCTWCLRSGMSESQLMKIGGWNSLEMISSTYAHLLPEDGYAALMKMLAKSA